MKQPPWRSESSSRRSRARRAKSAILASIWAKLRASASRGTGTTIYFHPDPTIFPRTEFNPDTLRDRLEIISFIHKGVRVTFADQLNNTKHTFRHDAGLTDLLTKLLQDRAAKPVHETAFTHAKPTNGTSPRLDMALKWTESTDEHLRSFVNGIPTASGGTHENGFRNGITKAIRKVDKNHMITLEGSNWSNSKLVFGGPSAYSCMTVLPGGIIGLFFESGEDHPYENMVFISFHPDELFNPGSLISKGNK